MYPVEFNEIDAEFGPQKEALSIPPDGMKEGEYIQKTAKLIQDEEIATHKMHKRLTQKFFEENGHAA
jgi:hypothetical protein